MFVFGNGWSDLTSSLVVGRHTANAMSAEEAQELRVRIVELAAAWCVCDEKDSKVHVAHSPQLVPLRHRVFVSLYARHSWRSRDSHGQRLGDRNTVHGARVLECTAVGVEDPRRYE